LGVFGKLAGVLLARRLLPYQQARPVVLLPVIAVANAYGEWRDLEDGEIEDLFKQAQEDYLMPLA